MAADPNSLDLDAQADGTAQFAAALEQMAAADKAATEAAERRASEVARLKQLYGDFAGVVEKAAARNKQLTDGVANGTYARQAREMERLARQYEKVRREVELIARYGNRLGGFVARNEGALGAANRAGNYAATATVATGASLVRQGFSGTVEGNRLSAEWNMLSREMAGAFKPLIDVTTKAVRGLRQFMETLGPAGQNVVMLGGLALSAGLAMKAVAGGGLIGAVGRAALGLGGAGAATAAVGAGSAGATAAVAAKATGGVSKLGRVGRVAGKAALPIALLTGGYDAIEGGYYEELRARGNNKFQAGIGAAGGAVGNFFSFGAYGEEFEKRKGSGVGPWSTQQQLADFRAGGGAGGRRSVTIAGGGFDEGGTGYERLATAIARVEAERTSKDDDIEGSIVPLLQRLVEIAEAEATKRGSPPLARPGEGAR